MTTCPGIPRIPEDVKGRFASMREYDIKMNRYANSLCTYFSTTIGDLTDITDTLDDHETRIDTLETTVTVLSSAPPFAMPIHLVQSNEIALAEHFVVDQYWNMVNAGPYYINGMLEVNGTTAFL